MIWIHKERDRIIITGFSQHNGYAGCESQFFRGTISKDKLNKTYDFIGYL